MSLLSYKDPSEIIPVTFLLGNEQQTGDNIVSCVVSASTYSGTDPNPQAIIFGSPDFIDNPPAVLQRIIGGIAGVSYLIRAVITLASGEVLVRQGILPVQTCPY